MIKHYVTLYNEKGKPAQQYTIASTFITFTLDDLLSYFVAEQIELDFTTIRRIGCKTDMAGVYRKRPERKLGPDKTVWVCRDLTKIQQ